MPATPGSTAAGFVLASGRAAARGRPPLRRSCSAWPPGFVVWASSCRCAPGCGRASVPGLQNWTSCYFGAVVLVVLGLFSRRLSA